MIGIQIGRGEFNSVPADYCDGYIGAFVGWCEDKPTFKNEIRQWLSDKLGVELKDGESMADAIMRTGISNAERKELAKLVHMLSMQAENWQTSDEDFKRMTQQRLVQQLAAKG